MAYQAIPRDSPDWKPEVADQLNVVIDRVERLINNYPNVTREHYYDNTKFLPVSITGEGCSIRTNASLHYGQVYVINFTFWLAEGFKGQLGSIAMSSSPSPAWIAARSGSGFKVSLYIDKGEMFIPTEYRGGGGVASVYGIIIGA